MTPRRPTEVIDRLIDAVLVGVRTIDVTERATIAWCEKARDLDLRCAPTDRRHSRYSGNLQLRHDIAPISKLARPHVTELVVACAKFIDHRRRENAGMQE